MPAPLVTSESTDSQPALPPRRPRGIRGQALVEYTLVLVMLLGVVLALVFFLAVFTEQGWRILQLVGLEFP